MPAVLEYKCPCCGAGLVFGDHVQKMTCQYCENEFTLDAVKAYNDSLNQENVQDFQWEKEEKQAWSEEEQSALRSFVCPSCGGELVTDDNTAATFCPYCENPAILPGRLSGGLKPEAVIPFQTSKEDAKAAFLKLCKGKPLLPKFFTQEQRLEKITGLYVPFWLYECSGQMDGSYQATRVQFWSDAKFNYTRTEHFLLNRSAAAEFERIPMDGSSKLDNALMESIEPYDYSQMVDFHTAYLSGFFADKYDVEAQLGQERIRQRVSQTMEDMVQSTLTGYATVIPSSKQLSVHHGKAKYALLPVWMLNTRYKDKIYTFVMNGQTGKMTGTFPICPKRTAAWFAGICACVTALVSLVQWIFF